MAVYHVDASYISKGKSEGGASRFSAYLERRDPEHATQHARYLARDGKGQEDLVASASAYLPQWAKNGEGFWLAADRYERQNGVVARVYQFTLPRELSAEGQRALADDLRAVFFEGYPQTWAIHNPPAQDGSGENAHLHIMFSTRREEETRTGGPKVWFSRAANAGQDARSGGVRKDGWWDQKAALQGVRYETAILINAALEREGIAKAVSHDRLRGQGHQRQGVHYLQFGKAEQRSRLLAKQEALHTNGTHKQEEAAARQAWEDQKRKEGLSILSREHLVASSRARYWAHHPDPRRIRPQEWEARRIDLTDAFAQTQTRLHTLDAQARLLTRMVGQAPAPGGTPAARPAHAVEEEETQGIQRGRPRLHIFDEEVGYGR
jgi:hypothetical protein